MAAAIVAVVCSSGETKAEEVVSATDSRWLLSLCDVKLRSFVSVENGCIDRSQCGQSKALRSCCVAGEKGSVKADRWVFDAYDVTRRVEKLLTNLDVDACEVRTSSTPNPHVSYKTQSSKCTCTADDTQENNTVTAENGLAYLRPEE
ncbi:hypothetical protein WMY93_031516 [Mugilogobius chulae]|uniref:Uncharacterized protein n=1 Tax=Mugilogobius chulae TaxID=88201 RepID=A0AAW0MFS7_9GOBI